METVNPCKVQEVLSLEISKKDEKSFSRNYRERKFLSKFVCYRTRVYNLYIKVLYSITFLRETFKLFGQMFRLKHSELKKLGAFVML